MAQKNTTSKQASTIPKVTTKSQEQPQDIIETYIIIWLDSNRDFSNQENQELITQLRSAVNIVKTFTDINQCITFLEQNENEKVFLIISDYFVKQIASLENQFPQLISIYIFCNQKSKHDEISKTFKNGKGVFIQMKLLCNELKKEVRQLNNDLTSTSIVSKRSTNNLNELKPSFMYFQLLKENLITIEYDHRTEIQQFVDYFQPRLEDEKDKRRAAEFEENYGKNQKTPIWWYTLDCFLYRTLNLALRTINIEILFKMGFFIRDLHEQIKQRHSAKLGIAQIPPTIYRGQSMPNNDFEQLKKAEGGLISFNSFLSTSIEKGTATSFLYRNTSDANKTAVLFEIKLDPSISSVPFTPIKELSAFPTEEEILFSLSTVFRIGEIKEDQTGLWRVNLTLTSERDPLLKRLTDHMQTSLGDGDGWRRLGQLMIKMGQFDKALEIYKISLKKVDPDDKAENAFLHNQLGYVWKQKENLEEAFSHYKESIRISRAYMSETDPRLSSTYSNIGGILKKLGNPNEALRWYELVLKIDLAAPKPNQLEIAIDHNNIGSVLDDLGKYSDALKSYEQALDIKLSHLPPYHPSLASTYSNIGLIHRKMGDCSTASVYYKKTLEIQQKSLPENHPSLSVTHGKLATVLEELHYKEAIEHAEQAVKIANAAFGSSHSEATKRQRYLDELRQKN